MQSNRERSIAQEYADIHGVGFRSRDRELRDIRHTLIAFATVDGTRNRIRDR